MAGCKLTRKIRSRAKNLFFSIGQLKDFRVNVCQNTIIYHFMKAKNWYT